MTDEAFLHRINRSYVLLIFRDKIATILLWFGIGACLLSTLIWYGLLLYVVMYWFASIALLIAVFSAFFHIRHFGFCEAMQYCDTNIPSGNRFSALYTAIHRDSPQWIRERLLRECNHLLSIHYTILWPIFRGRGRYFLIPWLSALLILFLPSPDKMHYENVLLKSKQKTSLASPVSHGEKDSDISNSKSGNAVAYRRSLSMKLQEKNPPLSVRQQIELLNMLNNAHVKKMLKELWTDRRLRTVSEDQKDIQESLEQGNKQLIKKLSNILEEIQGGSTQGRGSGLTDALKQAMDDQNWVRATAELENLLYQLSQAQQRRILSLPMHAHSNTRSQGNIPESDYEAFAKSDDSTFPIVVGVQYGYPDRYRKILRKYFSTPIMSPE